MENLRKNSRIVESVRIIVHTTGIWPNETMSDNHWSIYLILAKNDDSVHMNMKAELNDPKDTLEWSPKLLYTLTNSAIKHWDYKVKKGVTIANVYELVIMKRRNHYSMFSGGFGCRYWMYVYFNDLCQTICSQPLLIYNYMIVSDFGEKDYLITKNAGNDLYPKLLYQYSLTSHTRGLIMVKGVFTVANTSSTAPSSAGASFTAPKSTAVPPTCVKITKYTADEQLCYFWKSGEMDVRSFAKEWISQKNNNGTMQIVHKAKNLVSTSL